MAKIEKIENTNIKNTVDSYKEATAAGYGVAPIDIEGLGRVNMGYTSEEDREAGLKYLQMLVNNSENPMEIPVKMAQMGEIVANEVEPEEQVTINGVEVVIDVKSKKAYVLQDMENPIADMDDLPTVKDATAIKEVLKARAETAIGQLNNCQMRGDCDGDYENDEIDW